MTALSHSDDAQASPIARLIKATRIPDELQGRFRARQLNDVYQLTFISMVGMLINAFVLIASFLSSGADTMLMVWGGMLAFASGVMALGAIAERDKANAAERSVQALDRHARVSFLMGLIWAVAPLIVLPFADPTGQMMLCIIMCGVMFAGAFLMSRTPDSAMGFVAPILAGTLIALQIGNDPRNDYLSILIIIYGFILWLSIQWTYGQAVSEFLGQSAVEEQRQLISLLLRDFEESSSDWLWQTDENGLIVDLPVSSGKETGPTSSRMHVGVSLASLFEDDKAQRALFSCMRRRSAFKDIVVRVGDDDAEPVWWSVTGKPVFRAGQFTGFRGVASDVTLSKRAEDRVSYMAHYDSLTGLPNRATLMESMEQAFDQPMPDGYKRALLWIDLDNFKWVNDTLGHPAGDELLRMVAGRIQTCCTDGDVIARLGGDEFAVILERNERELNATLDRLIHTLQDPYQVFESIAQCGASIGVRLFEPELTDMDLICVQADLALYEAKNKGKGAWFVFDDELAEKAHRRRQVELDLGKACERNELQVHFQPLQSAVTGRVVAFETLLRWYHPERGLVMPSEFIEHAEDAGLISRIGDWVIRAALAEARRLPDDCRVAINISPLQIHSSGLLSTVMNALAANGIEPSRLELEITESVLMADTAFTLERLHNLKSLGVRIALDDFGTGYSSLRYLRAFPFDKIKIDKSFVRDLEGSEDARTITIATLKLAKALGMTCTAEGVETEFQRDFLSSNRCDELQGYLISKAQPLDNLQHLIELKPTLQTAQQGPSSDEREVRRTAAAR
ncbi:MAG: EAL domain-containing protein [Pseudomonadota bacterium]